MMLKRVLALLCVAALPWFAAAVQAEIHADEVLTDVGLSAEARQQVLSGEFFTGELPTISDRDLSVASVFLVKTSPEKLSQQLVAGNLIRNDPQVQSFGEFTGSGHLSDLARLHLTDNAAKAFASAQGGSALNLSTTEISVFHALSPAAPQAVQQQLHKVLLSRFQAYQASGLAALTPYDRGGGSSTDVAGDLHQATETVRTFKKYVPHFQQALANYPQDGHPGIKHKFYWLAYNIDGTMTYVLTHSMVATDGAARIAVQRQYYVSTGYNVEQAVVGLLPVVEGTVVVYSNHTFTDQVAGFGGSAKRNIGRRVMTGKLKQIFETARQNAAE